MHTVLRMTDSPGDLQAQVRVRALVKSGSAKALRESRGLGVSEIARAAGVSPRSLYRWERHLAMPHGPAALRYLQVLEDLMRST
jgi:DNA-binding transcriptional regulator YiaG